MSNPLSDSYCDYEWRTEDNYGSHYCAHDVGHVGDHECVCGKKIASEKGE